MLFDAESKFTGLTMRGADIQGLSLWVCGPWFFSGRREETTIMKKIVSYILVLAVFGALAATVCADA